MQAAYYNCRGKCSGPMQGRRREVPVQHRQLRSRAGQTQVRSRSRRRGHTQVTAGRGWEVTLRPDGMKRARQSELRSGVELMTSSSVCRSPVPTSEASGDRRPGKRHGPNPTDQLMPAATYCVNSFVLLTQKLVLESFLERYPSGSANVPRACFARGASSLHISRS